LPCHEQLYGPAHVGRLRAGVVVAGGGAATTLNVCGARKPRGRAPHPPSLRFSPHRPWVESHGYPSHPISPAATDPAHGLKPVAIGMKSVETDYALGL